MEVDTHKPPLDSVRAPVYAVGWMEVPLPKQWCWAIGARGGCISQERKTVRSEG
jgi:hypothetical protein